MNWDRPALPTNIVRITIVTVQQNRALLYENHSSRYATHLTSHQSIDMVDIETRSGPIRDFLGWWGSRASGCRETHEDLGLHCQHSQTTFWLQIYLEGVVDQPLEPCQGTYKVRAAH